MAKRLNTASKFMAQNYRERSQGLKIDRFFVELKQKDEERKAQEALELASSQSEDSFESKEIYSENGEGGEEQEMESKRDNFMKVIEKEMAKQLRIKDFSKEVSQLKVKGEADRMKLMARLVMMKR